jgi:hypothetical protein
MAEQIFAPGVVLRSLEYSENSIHTVVIESSASALIVRSMSSAKKVAYGRAVVMGQLDFDQLPAGVDPFLVVRRISELNQAAGNVVVVGKRIDAVRRIMNVLASRLVAHFASIVADYFPGLFQINIVRRCIPCTNEACRHQEDDQHD